MSATVGRYADYSSSCPRCQQIIQTIDITFQQGIFIYDLTFIQQELESVLVAAVQRQNQLLQSDEQTLEIPSSSMVQLPNGKKPRDFKAERERRRKALGGQATRKRRIKKGSKKHVVTSSQRARRQPGLISWKKHSSSTTVRSEANGHSTRPVRSYRPINFTYPFCYETNYRNGHHHSTATKSQSNDLPFPDQFWTKILALQQHDLLNRDDCKSIETLINIDQSLLNNYNDEKEYHQYRQMIDSTAYLLSSATYSHPELKYSLVLKQNTHFYNQVETILNKSQHRNGASSVTNHRLKRKDSAKTQPTPINIDDSLLAMLRRDNNTFPSKYAELQHRLAESISLERCALARAEQYLQQEAIRTELIEIDDKILEITNSIRQRKRPNENALSLCKAPSPTNHSNHQQNGTNENEAWRKGRRQSTLRIYDELARLVDERMELDKQLADINPAMEL